jgi:Putative MetA-pathway of phenol degradation
MRAIPMLLLAALSPLALHAQSAAQANSDTAGAGTISAQITDDSGSSSAPDSAAATADSTSSAASVPAQQSKSPQKPRPKPEVERPPAEGSMVGYIDNAIVGNEVRIRFDAGFDDNRPDRAEFFYAQCGCNLAVAPNAPGPKPGLVTHLNFQQLYMRAEYAPVQRLSFYADVPIRWVQPQTFVPASLPPGSTGFGNQSGISDVWAGFKFAALSSSDHYLTFQFSAGFPSGDSSKGLGTNHYSIQPELLYYQRITDRWSFEGQIGDTHPIGSSSAPSGSPTGPVEDFAGDVFVYGLGPSYQLYKGENVRITPVLELVGWRLLSGLETNGNLIPNYPIVSSDGINIVNLKAGFRTSVGNHNSIYIGYGQALTHEMWYKHIVRIEYRYTF